MEERRDKQPPIAIECNQVALGPLRRDLIRTYQRRHVAVSDWRDPRLTECHMGLGLLA